MMNTMLRNNIRTGIISGVVVVYIMLIGFTVISSTIIGNMFNIEPTSPVGNYTGLMILWGLFGLFTGAIASRGETPLPWVQSGLAGLLAGATLGIFSGVFLIIVGSFSGQGTDYRAYLAQLSPDAIDLLNYGQTSIQGALINLAIFTISALFGALLSKLLNQIDLKGRYETLRRNAQQSTAKSPLLAKLASSRIAKFALYGLLLLIALLIPQFTDQYWNFILGTVGIYVMMGLGLNIVVGLAGLLDLGYVAFFAVGAYTMGLLTSPAPLGLEWDFWVVLPIAILIAAFSGVLLGIPVLRLRGDYLAIVTLGFGEIIRVLVKSDLLAPVLGGPQGVRDIAGPTIFGRPFDNERAFLYMIIFGIVMVIIITINLQSSRVGRSWMAMREDETVAQAMGVNTYQSKLLAFAIGAAFAGLGGVLFASRNQYTGPEDHNLLVSINVLSIVIVGGMGSIPGVILGAFALKGLPEILRQIEDYRILAFGGLLVVMMIWRPEGLWPAKRRALEIHPELAEQPPPDLPEEVDQADIDGGV